MMMFCLHDAELPSATSATPAESRAERASIVTRLVTRRAPLNGDRGHRDDAAAPAAGMTLACLASASY